MKNEIEQSWEVHAGWVIDEIRKRKALFMHACFKAIMPPEIYAKAAAGNDMALCKEWATREGYKWLEKGTSTLLLKGEQAVAGFRPVLKGEKEDRHMEFMCQILGTEVDLVGPDFAAN